MDFKNWLRGLIAAVIGGAANAVTMLIVDPNDFNLQSGLPRLGTVAFVNALVSAAMYLKTHPIPKEEQNETGFE